MPTPFLKFGTSDLLLNLICNDEKSGASEIELEFAVEYKLSLL